MAGASAFPDCKSYKVPPELNGKKGRETTFDGPGGAVTIVHIGSKILCEVVEQGVPSADRRQDEQKILSGKKLKLHKPALEDFSVGYAGPDCTSEYQDCYDSNSPNYPDRDACAEFAARCR